MNIGEANAANVLMRAALGQEVDADRIREAGWVLARNAHKALMAGFTPQSWSEAWADRTAACPCGHPNCPGVSEEPRPDPWEVEHNPRCNRLCDGGVHHLEAGDTMDPVR